MLNRRPFERCDRDALVTGVGAVTSLGPDAGSLWENTLAGRTGIGPVRRFDASWLPVCIAAEIPERAEENAEQLTLAISLDAAREALAGAGLLTGDGTAADRGLEVILGTTRGELYGFERAMLRVWDRPEAPGRERLQRNAAADNATYGFLDRLGETLRTTGRRELVSCACASGAYALGRAAQRIRDGRAERVLCGGADVISELYYTFFCGARLLDPEACRPFDRRRRGTVFGEGAALLVLESRAAARARGARPLARLAGFGWSSDAHHFISPHPQGAGAAACLRDALQDAGRSAADLGAVVAHGTGTVSNDKVEARVLRDLLGAVPVTAPKSMLGHTFGASSAVEAILGIQTLNHGLIPPTAGVEALDPDCPVDLVTSPRALSRPAVLTNASGFGGNNAALVFVRDGGGEARDA